MSATNVVIVKHLCISDTNAAHKLMSGFGDIAKIEAASNKGFLVEYFDSSAAVEAIEALQGCCQPIPAVCKVQISGMPLSMLSDAMMEVMFEQCGLGEKVLNFSTERGIARGTAIVCFSDMGAAKACVRHFNGREWGSASLTAKIVSEDHDQPKHIPIPSYLTAGSCLESSFANTCHSIDETPVYITMSPSLCLDEAAVTVSAPPHLGRDEDVVVQITIPEQ